MLHSLELKRELAAIQASLKKKVENQETVSAEEQQRLQDALDEYKKAVAAETAEKGKKTNMEKVTRGMINAALKDFLRGDREKMNQLDATMKAAFQATATGQNGAVSADGGFLIPEILLPIVENDRQGVDLRSIVTGVTVGTRSGKIPVIDYANQAGMALEAFDENNSIKEGKAAFTQLAFTLASKGALIPVSNELIRDSATDIVALIATLFNRIYINDVNKDILAKAVAPTDVKKNTVADFGTVAAIDAIKKAIITCPLDAGANASVVVNQNTFAAMALAKDTQGRYLLARDANNETVRQIESRPIHVVEGAALADDTAVVGDYRALYHIAYPALEVQSSTEAGFRTNSTIVRAVARFTDLNTYGKCFTVLSKTGA